MSFMIYDIILLVLFSIFAGIFLYKNRKKLEKDGMLFLYRTKWGIKLINKIGNKYQKLLKFFSYISIGVGYILMIIVVYLILKTTYIYFTSPLIKQIKVPPLMPIVPYINKIVPGLPVFYFVYFIIAILIVATIHEFSHGIFARRFGINIKSTGFAFFKYFPAFFGAFVEQDDKQMKEKTKFEQMSVLSAGVFANIIMTLIFLVILLVFFSLAFTPAGVQFNSYSSSIINISEISSINNVSVKNIDSTKLIELMNGSILGNIKAGNKTYAGVANLGDGIKILVYDDSPAIKAKLTGAITSINGANILNLETLKEELSKYSPGEEVIIKTTERKYNIILGENPLDKNKPFLGIGFPQTNKRGIMGKIAIIFSYFKKPEIYYKPKCSASSFFYNLLWWIMLINLAVALFNMLPLGFLDGGRFFYLTILGITKSKNTAKKSFSIATHLILFLFLLLMIRWVFLFFFNI